METTNETFGYELAAIEQGLTAPNDISLCVCLFICCLFVVYLDVLLAVQHDHDQADRGRARGRRHEPAGEAHHSENPRGARQGRYASVGQSAVLVVVVLFVLVLFHFRALMLLTLLLSLVRHHGAVWLVGVRLPERPRDQARRRMRRLCRTARRMVRVLFLFIIYYCWFACCSFMYACTRRNAHAVLKPGMSLTISFGFDGVRSRSIVHCCSMFIVCLLVLYRCYCCWCS